MCKIKTEHNNKQKNVYFLCHSSDGKLFMRHANIEILDILTVNYKTVGTQEPDQATKCSTNKDIGQHSVDEQLYTNPRQEADRPEK